MLLDVDHELQADLVCCNKVVRNRRQEKVLSIGIDYRINFAGLLPNITKNANIKPNALI